MNQFTLLLIGFFSLAVGSTLGYFARQSIAKKQADSVEAKLEKKVLKAKETSDVILAEAQTKANQIVELAQKETSERRNEILQTERIILKRENSLSQKLSLFEKKEEEFQQKVEKLKEIKESLEGFKQAALDNLERISGLNREDAKKEIFQKLEQEYQREILERIKKIEREGWEQYDKKARELLTTAIQKCALNQSQEITTTTVNLPSDEIKGRIIGKEGRNIRTLEKLTGTELIIDEIPEAVIISGFDPVRRQIAKIALEKLIQDGRIQPARIEEQVELAEKGIAAQIKEAGEAAIYEAGIVGLDLKLIQLLGRLKFRTSYGQNVLLHSMEVAYLASALAAEIGANASLCKKAGLLHDIGKSVDHQIEGSHVDIGIKILEKFGVEKEVVSAMKSHHGDYPAESIEAVLVQTADQISGARPGARKDTLENYLKRLEELEKIALNFTGVDKAWALQAGREIRVFVKPGEVDDLQAQNLARSVANKIQEELKYPGEIKVTVIRETRIIEYAK